MLAPPEPMDTPHAQRVRERMKRFVGVHLACFGTPDAAAEQRRLAAQGFEPEPVVHLERNWSAATRASTWCTCRRRRCLKAACSTANTSRRARWRARFVNPFALSAVYVVADDPEEVAARWGRFCGLLPRPKDGFVRLDTARGQRRDRQAKAYGKRFWAGAPAAPGARRLCDFRAVDPERSPRAAARQD